MKTPTVEGLKLAVDVVIPLLSDAGRLFSNIMSGARSLATARAELRAIAVTTLDRCDAAEAEDARRDQLELERVTRESE